MEANLLTLLRILLVFAVIGLYRIAFWTDVAALCLTAVVIYMDALDGLLARRLGIASKLGALFDITGDRIVENVLWVYFAAIGMVSLWAAVIVVARSFLVDWLRVVAFSQEGTTPFGEKTMLKTSWAKALASSRFSRGLYGVTKAIVFVYLGGLLALESGRAELGWRLAESSLKGLQLAGQILVWLTVFMCIVRGIPVLWDSREVLTRKMFPASLEN